MKKNRLAQSTAGIFLTVALMLFSGAVIAEACTAVYVGRDASQDGTMILARSNDYQAVWPNHVIVVDRVEDEPGRVMPVDNGNTVFAELPATTYKYTATPFMDSSLSINGLQQDAAACANEYGVVMTMSITAFTRDEALSADPLIENGITEFSANDLVICQSKTAREAVDVLLGLIDRFGSSECNIALIADQNEAWCVEMYTGHQYAAVKLPPDMVAVFGNEFSLEYVSDYADAIVSENLETLADDNGFAVRAENGELNLLATYAIDPINYSHMRTWIGHRILSPSSYGEYDLSEKYPLVFEADEQISLKDVMEIMRNRFDGTKYSPDETGRIDMRVIGTDVALSVHVLQVDPALPADMSCITWVSTAPALYGVFVPVSSMSIGASDSYSLNQPAEDFGKFASDTYPWYAFKELNTLGVSDSRLYGNPVRAYWSQAESDMIAGMRTVLQTAVAERDNSSPEDVAAYITDYCNGLQEQAFSDARSLLNDVRWSMSKNSNTMKAGRNPETHEATDEETIYDPMIVSLFGSDYADVPAFAGRENADD